MTAFRRLLLLVQGLYYTVTGIWPLVSITSFESVTGPKTDDWLVQTVGLLICVVGAALIVAAAQSALNREAVVLSTCSAVAFIAVDVFFYLRGQIGAVYLIDAVAQCILIMLWIYTFSFARRVR